MKTYDVDKSGTITFNEFVNLVSSPRSPVDHRGCGFSVILRTPCST